LPPKWAASNFQKVQEAGELLGQLQQPQGVTERRSIQHDAVVFAGRESLFDSQQGGDFRQPGQGCIQQGLNLLAGKDGAALYRFQQSFLVFADKSAEFLLRIHLP
jgi:hypothetical protein